MSPFSESLPSIISGYRVVGSESQVEAIKMGKQAKNRERGRRVISRRQESPSLHLLQSLPYCQRLSAPVGSDKRE
jgi:hypothetical protein